MNKKTNKKLNKQYTEVAEDIHSFLDNAVDSWDKLDSRAVLSALTETTLDMVYFMMVFQGDEDKEGFYKFISISIKSVEDKYDDISHLEKIDKEIKQEEE